MKGIATLQKELNVEQLTRYIHNACNVERLSDLRNFALIKACCVAWAYFIRRSFLGSPNMLSHSWEDNDVVARR